MRIAESSARELHLDSNARSSGMDSTRARTTTCHLMGDVEMLTFPDGRALAQAAAKQWLQQVQARAPQPSPYCLALSGGRIAGRFFEAVVELAREQHAAFMAAEFFWGDERCVPPSDPESNFGLARALLLVPLGIPEKQVHRIVGEAPPAEAAARAEADLRRIAPANAAADPVLDMIFLGMGEDGHAASLFPGEAEEVMNLKAVFRPVIASKPPPQRITIGYPTIAAAKQSWVLVSGPDKA